MDTKTLVREDIKLGKELIKHFDDKGLDIKIAFWYLDEEIGRWYLFISTLDVESEGPRKVYRQLLDAMDDINTEIRFDDLKVVSYNSSIVKLLKSVVQTDKNGIDSIRLQGNAINGVYLEDVLIYRVN